MLFVRHLQFLLSLLVGAAIFVSLRGVLRSGAAALLLAVHGCCLRPVRHPQPELQHDRRRACSRPAACSDTSRSGRRRASRGSWSRESCHGLAVFAYPSLVVAVVVCFGLRLALAPSRWRREIVGFGVPALVVGCAAMGSVVGVAGLHNVVSGYRRSSDYLGHSGGIEQDRRRLRPRVVDAPLLVPRAPRARAARRPLALAAPPGAARARPAAAPRPAGLALPLLRLTRLHGDARVRRPLRRARAAAARARLAAARGEAPVRGGVDAGARRRLRDRVLEQQRWRELRHRLLPGDARHDGVPALGARGLARSRADAARLARGDRARLSWSCSAERSTATARSRT